MHKFEKSKKLTRREKEVMSYVAKVMSNREISDKLCVTISTVKAHVSSAIHKLKAKNRMDAALIFLKNQNF